MTCILLEPFVVVKHQLPPAPSKKGAGDRAAIRLNLDRPSLYDLRSRREAVGRWDLEEDLGLVASFYRQHAPRGAVENSREKIKNNTEVQRGQSFTEIFFSYFPLCVSFPSGVSGPSWRTLRFSFLFEI